MTSAKIGYNATFEVGDGASPEVFTALGEVVSITPPPDTTELIEATHLTSPNRTREYVRGLTDPGETEVVINYVPGDATDTIIQGFRSATAAKNCRIVLPPGGTGAKRWTFAALMTGWSVNELVVDGVMQGTLTLKLTGDYTIDTVP